MIEEAYIVCEEVPDAACARPLVTRVRRLTSAALLVERVDILEVGTDFRIVALVGGAAFECRNPNTNVWVRQSMMIEG